MFSNNDEAKLVLLAGEIIFGLLVLAIAYHLLALMASTNDWFGCTLPALVLIVVGIASISFGVNTFWLREDVDRWRPWE